MRHSRDTEGKQRVIYRKSFCKHIAKQGMGERVKRQTLLRKTKDWKLWRAMNVRYEGTWNREGKGTI